MKSRSPILGYNHNVRYAGRLWHVQTEDSGVQNPRIFTHLFHDGTILATKRIDYDGAAEVSAVQKLMQTQHKAMLRELKAGTFDDKISKYFGEPVDKSRDDESTDPNARPPIIEMVAEPTEDRTDTPLDLPQIPEVGPGTRMVPQQPPAAPSRPNVQQSRPATAQPQRPAAQKPAGAAPTRPVPQQPSAGGLGRRPSATYATAKPSAEGVVVARPAVIIGGDPRAGTQGGSRPQSSTRIPQSVAGSRAHNPPPPPAPQTPMPPRKDATNENIFGADLISEKSLDEVILAYLSEDLNEK
jgi:hypothetical protein